MFNISQMFIRFLESILNIHLFKFIPNSELTVDLFFIHFFESENLLT